MRKSIVLQSFRLGIPIGMLLALYIFVTVFVEFSHESWLLVHNLVVIVSLLIAAFIGYNHRYANTEFGSMLISVAVFFGSIMFLYIGTYLLTTLFFAEKMAWIPFFYRDYNYHSFGSVAEYLNQTNFRDLLVLQVFSFLVGSIMYFGAAIVGYFVLVLIRLITASRLVGRARE